MTRIGPVAATLLLGFSCTQDVPVSPAVDDLSVCVEAEDVPSHLLVESFFLHQLAIRRPDPGAWQRLIDRQFGDGAENSLGAILDHLESKIDGMEKQDETSRMPLPWVNPAQYGLFYGELLRGWSIAGVDWRVYEFQIDTRRRMRSPDTPTLEEWAKDEVAFRDALRSIFPYSAYASAVPPDYRIEARPIRWGSCSP